MKPRIVLSGVNFTDMGPLAVYKDALISLVQEYSDRFEIIALVHRKSLFDMAGVTFMEYPEVKASWFSRVRFEYSECRAISEQLKPHLWLSMHDMTPNVTAAIRAVYCHNPSPFYPFRAKDAMLDWKFALFTLFYRFLYGINIRSNDFVVVQQQWMRTEFQKRYRVRRVVVAHPSIDQLSISTAKQRQPHTPYRFFYPAYPRTFKNMEQILRAARRLERQGVTQFEVWLTMDGTETRYARGIMREFHELTTVRWLGVLPRSEVLRLYGEADCLVFPSKLETWGMPITEFEATGKPILLANLPYAHETVNGYSKVAFFEIGDDAGLAEMMRQAADLVDIFGGSVELVPDPPFSRNWSELWRILLKPEAGK